MIIIPLVAQRKVCVCLRKISYKTLYIQIRVVL